MAREHLLVVPERLPHTEIRGKRALSEVLTREDQGEERRPLVDVSRGAVVAHKNDGEIGVALEHASKVSLEGGVDEFEVLAIRVRCKELHIAEQRPSLRRRQACVWCRRAIVLVAALVFDFVGNRGQRSRILLEETVGVFLLR